MKKIQFEKYLGISLLIIASLASLSTSAQEKKDPVKVLFVGNSFTFFWNMPQLVGAMSKSLKVDMEAYQSTVGGSNWEEHWKGEAGTKTQKLLQEGKWDYVVLGDHSLSTIKAPERFKEYGKKFAELIRSKGAEPVFFMTWAYKSNPLMQQTITDGYMNLSRELHAKVLPIGPVWMKARDLRPDLELYLDNKHPSADGTFLTALTITKLITGKSVEEIPDRLTTFDEHGEKLYLTLTLPSTGDFFRQLVEEMNFEPYRTQK